MRSSRVAGRILRGNNVRSVVTEGLPSLASNSPKLIPVAKKLLAKGTEHRILPFGELPVEAQKAIFVYYRDGWGFDTLDDAREQLRGYLFGIANISMEDAQKAVMQAPALRGHKTFSVYHKQYIGSPPYDFRAYSKTWPVVLASNGDEVFEDGWHRFHAYVERGEKTIPVIYQAGRRGLKISEAVDQILLGENPREVFAKEADDYHLRTKFSHLSQPDDNGYMLTVFGLKEGGEFSPVMISEKLSDEAIDKIVKLVKSFSDKDLGK